MKIGFMQFSPNFGDVQVNLDKICEELNSVDADLVVIPELANSGYLFKSIDEVSELAEEIPGPTTERLQSLANDNQSHYIMGMPERAGDQFFNSAVFVGPSGVIGVYRKAHLFYEEKLYFSPGDTGFSIFDMGDVKVGVLICFDHLFPEAARSLALQGAQIICYPSNLVLPTYGQLTTRVRAVENQVFTILANRSGKEDRGDKKLTYTGCSQIVGPDGNVLAEAAATGDSVQIVEIDPELALDKRITERNDLFGDRRPELYANLS